MGILTKMQNTSKLAATEYGSAVNPSLMRAMQAASEFDRFSESSDASDDLLAELYENADYALSDLQSRMQEYNIHVTSVRDLSELFLSSYRELYVSTIVPSLQAKVKDFESLLEVINARCGFKVNTLRDGGVAAIVSKLKSDGVIDEHQYSVITVARRIRNRLAHRFLEFESMDEKRHNEMLASLRKAVDILVPIAG